MTHLNKKDIINQIKYLMPEIIRCQQSYRTIYIDPTNGEIDFFISLAITQEAKTHPSNLFVIEKGQILNEKDFEVKSFDKIDVNKLIIMKSIELAIDNKIKNQNIVLQTIKPLFL